MDQLIAKATDELSMDVKRFFNSAGDLVQTMDVIRDGDTLICAGDEPFVQGKFHVTRIYSKKDTQQVYAVVCELADNCN